MAVHIRIQHAAGRSEPLTRLLGQLGQAVIVTDFDKPPNPWRGYQMCLEDPPEGHLCILQDDVVLSSDFKEKLERAVSEKPESVISLFVGALPGRTTVDFRKAMIAGSSWSRIFFQDIHHCVALVWPKQFAIEFLEWARTTKVPGLPENNMSDDALVSAWAKLTGKEVWATVPSLVEHDDIYESTIGKKRGDKGRRAIHFVP